MKTLKILFIMSVTTLNLTAQSANVQTAMDGYARFGRGDIAGILDLLSDDIVWVHAGDAAIVPFGGIFQGKEEVSRFFQIVGQDIQITVFQPANFRESGNQVINDVHIEGLATPTGRPFVSDLTMTWTFAADGKVLRWEAAGDMSAAEAAFRK